MTNYGINNHAIEQIEENFETEGTRMIDVLRSEDMDSSEEVRLTLADYLEYLYETEEGIGEILTEKRVEATFDLTIGQRIKVLLLGKVVLNVTPLVDSGICFGLDWQTEDILELLKGGDE